MVKYYYENILFNQNKTAKPNITWVADITTLDTIKNYYVFLCIDVHTNYIVTSLIKSTPIESSAIVRVLSKAIEKRFKAPPKTKLILHTDRGTQFSSKSYNNFVNKYEKYIVPSMTRPNTPTDNAIAERFMRTFKEHTDEKNGLSVTISEQIFSYVLANPDFRSARSVLNRYVKSLNNRPNKKTLKLAPKRADKEGRMASQLMIEPIHPKAFSEHFGTDYRLKSINNYKSDNLKIRSILAEIAAKKAEVVNDTPFDNFDDNLALNLIDKRLNDIYALLERNPDITQTFVEEAIQPIEESLEELHLKVDKLLPSPKKQKQTLPLRDPATSHVFEILMTNAGNVFKQQKNLKSSQLRILYTILYHTGLRLNEARHLTYNDIQKGISSSQLSVIHHKTRSPHIHILSKKALKDLKSLNTEYQVVFEQHQFKYLFGKLKPIAQKSLIRLVNRDLKYTREIANIPFNIKSHSFRINLISSLLKITSVQHVADIIGHDDIRSTLKYQRYALEKEEVQNLLDKINNLKN